MRKIFALAWRNGILDSPEHEQEGELLGYRCVESFFKTLKRKLETLDDKHSVTELGQSVFMYVEAYYNRMHWIRALEFTLFFSWVPRNYPVLKKPPWKVQAYTAKTEIRADL